VSRALGLAFLLVLAASLAAAPFDKGGVLGEGAHAAAQAGAVVARPDIAEGIWWNPAGLGLRHDLQLGLGYGDVLGGTHFDSAFSHRGWLDEAGLGYGLGYRRTGFDVDVAEEEYALALAFPFTEDGRLQTGLTLRALQDRVLDLRASGYGVDLGLHYRAPAPVEGLSAGIAVRDLQASLEWPAGPRADPAQLFQFGLAWAFDANSSLEIDSEFVSDPSAPSRGTQGFKLGGERWWDLPRFGLKHLAALRLGFAQSNGLAGTVLGGEFSAGLGLQFRGASVDYAFTQGSGSFGPSHRLSADYAFSAAPAERPSETPAPTPGPGAKPAEAAKLELGLTAEPALFNPARGQALILQVQAPAGAKADNSYIEIKPLSGPAVAVQRVDGIAKSLKWDGQRPGGGEAPPGAYSALLRAFDAEGRTLAAAEAKFTLERGSGKLRLSPEADIFAPIAQSVRPEARLAVGYDGSDAQRWTLSVAKAGEARPLRVSSGKGLPKGLSWNGKDRGGKRAPDGTYDLRLDLLLRGGTTVTAKAQVSIDTRRPRLDLEAVPRVFDGGTGLSFKTGLNGEAGILSRWTLRVESLEGKALRSFEGAGAPPASVAWNGKDENGKAVAPGALFYADFRVETESGALATLPRTSLASKLEAPKLPFRVPLLTLHFSEGDEVIALEDYAGLKEAAAAVKKYSSDYVVQVEGHASGGESGRGGLGDLELSFLRAKAVRDYLIDSEGLDAGRVKPAGVGDEGADSTDAAKSRRVEVILYAQ
jgi:outer membrane protein OmpA-like peptidoglycan-associated protein